MLNFAVQDSESKDKNCECTEKILMSEGVNSLIEIALAIANAHLVGAHGYKYKLMIPSLGGGLFM